MLRDTGHPIGSFCQELTFAVADLSDRLWSKAAALPARGMEVSGNSMESAVRYTAWWCAMIGGNIGP